MPTPEELYNNPQWKRLMDKMASDSLGTIRLEKQNGKLIGFRGPTGQLFNSPKQAAEWVINSGFKKRDVFSTGMPGRIASSPTGSYSYLRLQSIFNKLAPGDDTFQIAREAYGVQRGGAQVLSEMMVRNGKTFGFAIPDDETTTLIRMFSKGNELERSEIEKRLKGIGYNFADGSRDPADLVKLFKRLKVLGNTEAYYSDFGRGLKVGVFGVGDAEKEWEGASLLNPNTLMSMAKTMKSTLTGERAWVATRSTEEQFRFGKTLDDVERNIEKLQHMAKHGGRFQDFRATGFDLDVLKQMKLSEPEIAAIHTAMIKGDVLVPALGKEWQAAAFRAGMRLPKGLNAAEMDIIAPATNFAKQLGVVGYGEITLKPSHAAGFGRPDPQFLAAYGEQLWGRSFEQVGAETKSWYTSQLEHMSKTGNIPTGYEDSLKRLAGIGDIENLDPSFIAKLMKDTGIQDITSLANQQSRARRILAMQAMGYDTSTNKGMFNEVARGLRKSVARGGKREGQLYGYLPATVQGHITSGHFSNLLGLGESIGPGQMGFDERYGFFFNPGDFVSKLYEAHGGADFDDRIESMLRYDETGKRFISINRRSPGGLGEISVLEPNDNALTNMARAMTQDLGSNVDLRKGLENIDFYNLRKYESRIQRHEDLMALNPQDQMNRLRGLIRVRRHADLDALEEQIRNLPKGPNSRSIRENLLDQRDQIRSDELGKIIRESSAKVAGYRQQSTSIRSKLHGVLRANVPHIGAEDLGVLQAAAIPSQMQKLNENNYYSILEAQRQKFESLAPQLEGATTLQELFKGRPEALATILSPGHEGEAAMWRHMLRQEGGKGVLNKYSLVREMADEYVMQIGEMQKLGGGKIPILPQEAVIDTLTQGISKEYRNLGPEHIEAASMSLIEGLVNQVKATGIKLDPERLSDRFGYNSQLEQILHLIDPSLTRQDIVMSDEERAGLMGQYGRSKAVQRSIQDDLKAVQFRYASGMEQQRAIRRTAFTQSARDDAQAMAQSYTQTFKAAQEGHFGISNMEQIENLGRVVEDIESEGFARTRAREAVQRTYAGFLEEGKMGARATNAMGAFIQQYEDHGVFSSVQNGIMAEAQAVTRGMFDVKSRPMGILGQATSAEDIRRYKAAYQASSHAKDITEDMLLRGIEYSELPGEARATRMGKAFDVADAVAKGLMGKGPQGTSAAEHFAGLMEHPLARKAGITVAALAIASTIYKGVRDRTNSDMEGPPLLPGGSSYEDNINNVPPPPVQPYRPPQQPNGVRYRIRTRGGNHAKFRQSAESMLGIKSSGTIYPSRDMSNNQSDPRSTLNEAFR